MPMKPEALLCVAGLALAGAAGHASNCEPLRARIDASIAAKGITDYAVTVVDKDAQVAGQVVGTCDGGARKVVYVRGGAAGGTARTKRDDTVLTECRDGRVQVGGSCR